MSIRDLRFLIDENIDKELVLFLRAEGFDVFDIKEGRTSPSHRNPVICNC